MLLLLLERVRELGVTERLEEAGLSLDERGGGVEWWLEGVLFRLFDKECEGMWLCRGFSEAEGLWDALTVAIEIERTWSVCAWREKCQT